MITNLKIDNLRCDCLHIDGSARIAYMIYPDAGDFFPEQWIISLGKKYNVSVVIIYVPFDKWNDMLTPWDEPPEAPGFEPFAGKAADTLQTLQSRLIPRCEKEMGICDSVERSLIGVSLSGLFTLWQWLICDSFHSIACLSGSFWYNGFMEWFDKRNIPCKDGKAYFLLGKQEPKASVKAYRTVGINTEAIYGRIKSAGIETQFDWVPGNHISNPLPRAEKAFEYLYKTNIK